MTHGYVDGWMDRWKGRDKRGNERRREEESKTIKTNKQQQNKIKSGDGR